jgi:transposase
MLMVGRCYGIRSERRLGQEVELHLAYLWFCNLDLDDEIPHHSMFSANRLGRFRESDILRHIFERVVWSRLRSLVTRVKYGIAITFIWQGYGFTHTSD